MNVHIYKKNAYKRIEENGGGSVRGIPTTLLFNNSLNLRYISLHNVISLMYYVQNGVDDGQGAREDGEELEHEEQAVNLRRQKRDKSKRGSVKGVAHSNSSTSVSGSSKPDNIAQAGSEVERARDMQRRTMYVSDLCS
jgi:hypothetical protein